MVKACRGLLLRCSDASIKELVLSFDEEASANEDRAVIDVLDDTHLLVREDAREPLLRKLRLYHDKLAFDPHSDDAAS
jgi:hypothetical protein